MSTEEKTVKYNPQSPMYDWRLYTPGEGMFFCKFYDEPEMTGGGLYRPDAFKRREIVGEVLGLGEAKPGQRVCIKVGDTVMANPDYGVEINKGYEEVETGGKVEFTIKIMGYSDIVAYREKS